MRRLVRSARTAEQAWTVAGPTALASPDLNDFPCSLTKANLTFAANENVHVLEVDGNNLTRVVLVCESGTPEALTVT